jgi:hypothetical protein
VCILDPNWPAAFALAAAIACRLPPPLAAIEAGRRTRTSSRSFPSSSCSWRTPTLSRRCHLSLEGLPRCRKPQSSSAKSFAALGEHPRDLFILPFSSLCLVHRSALAAVLRWVARSAMVPSGFPYRTTVGRAGADLHRPFVDRWPRLEPEDTPFTK